MLILPAIDVLDGKCVRLAQGKFEDVTTYGDPSEQAAVFSGKGAKWIHVVDLDGAREGRPMQHQIVRRIARAGCAKIQFGGGVRQFGHIQSLFDAGVSRVVLGSAAVQRPDEVLEWVASFGAERVCCALDARLNNDRFEVVVKGWASDSGINLDAALGLYPPGTMTHVLVTDIARDGMLAGPNLALIRELAQRRPDLHVQASGGVSSLADISSVKTSGASAVIIGRALYEQRFTLEDALAL